MMYTKKQDKFAATFEEKTKECPLYARNMLALENMEFSRKEINMTKKYDEKEISICKVIRDYYESTYKDVNRYVYKLSRVSNKNIDEIYVIGHSVAEVDLPYFRYIENCTHRQSNWIVYFFNKEEKDRTYKNLMDSGIQKSRIQMKEASEFYNL